MHDTTVPTAGIWSRDEDLEVWFGKKGDLKGDLSTLGKTNIVDDMSIENLFLLPDFSQRRGAAVSVVTSGSEKREFEPHSGSN